MGMTDYYTEDKKFTVLLVEDDLNDIFLVKRAFKKAQIQNPLQVVTDGQEKLQSGSKIETRTPGAGGGEGQGQQGARHSGAGSQG